MFGRLGYNADATGGDPLYRQSSGLVSGPKGLWLSASDFELIEIEILVEYLIEKGLDEEALREAIDEIC